MKKQTKLEWAKDDVSIVKDISKVVFIPLVFISYTSLCIWIGTLICVR